MACWGSCRTSCRNMPAIIQSLLDKYVNLKMFHFGIGGAHDNFDIIFQPIYGQQFY